MGDICFRFAGRPDGPLLAALNARLIRDEGHRNPMTQLELERRMADWLAAGEYEAVLFEEGDRVCGYALFRREPAHVYLRQFYVEPDHRCQGIGRRAMTWLRENAWKDAPRVRLDVLVGNAAGIAFWKSLGFREYSLTLERDNTVAGQGG